jgi:predicted  nucleic acid-binding Zn ribbon protein
MYIHEISIEIRPGTKKEMVFNEFSLLMGAYRQSGQASSVGGNAFWDGSRIVGLLITIERDALKTKYNNIYVNARIAALEALCRSTLQFRIAGKDNDNGVCKCKSPEFYILFTHLFNDASAVECGKCAKPVPLYCLPYYDAHSYHSIQEWERQYKACDQLQLGCTVGEKWALRQMQDANSQLSKEGRSICARMEELTKIPFYYYLFNYRKIKPGQQQSNCPGCGNMWSLNEQLHGFYDYNCEACRLVSSETCNS